jgi:FMN-dependent NADH-azoreductase
MSTLLHIDSSILGAHSVSRTLSASVVAQLQTARPDVQVAYRDLAAAPIAHLSGGYLAAGQTPAGTHDAAVLADLALGRTVLEEFLAAATIVLGIGFYNFGIPSQLKAWVDRIAVAGKTFRYTERGPQGLAGGKRVILAIARGGHYGAGTPAAALEHAESCLLGLFGFFGITDVRVVAADGLAAGPEARQTGIAKAHEHIAALAA